MDIENLETFIEVAESRSFSQSAKALSLTQPAVSKRIASLETSLATKLFDRVGRTVHLTEAGRILLPSAKQIQSELARIEDVICNIGNSVHGRLAIGTTELIATRQFPGALQRYREEYPEVRLDLRFQSIDEVMAGVEQHHYELALFPLAPFANTRRSPKLTYADIWRSEMKIAVASNDPLAKDSELTLAKLAQSSAILPPRKTFVRSLVDNALLEADADANVILETNDYNTMRSMASVGLGWTCLPDFQIDDSLIALDIDNVTLEYDVALVHSKDLTLSRAAQTFIETLSAAA